MKKVNVFWFRRDLRIHDNAGLYHALKAELPVLPIFIFDSTILSELDADDRRVQFIHNAILEIQDELKKYDSDILVVHSTPMEAFQELIKKYSIEQVFTNHDYEPYAKQRDTEIESFLNSNSVGFKTFKDQVIFEKDEVMKDDGLPYTVFTPYSKKWKARLNDFYLSSYSVEIYTNHFLQNDTSFSIPTLKDLGFTEDQYSFPNKQTPIELVTNYDATRDYPSQVGTSELGIHLRFGTISIRDLARKAKQLNEVFLNELIWREFYQCILWHFPHVVNASFKSKYDAIQWRNNETEFTCWCEGKTGYPIVDAGMRQLNETGWMHNRVRMIVASFLCKHLLIDWRWGEAYFAKKLNDFDLASNNGGWQWAAGSGVDAAPYFRIFNPYLQTAKFDAKLDYIKKWVPEFEEFTYPQPIVKHEDARVRCLEVYKKALGA